MPGLNYAGFTREAIITTPTWPSTSPALITELLPWLSLAPAGGVSKQFVADHHGAVGYSQADVVQLAPRLSGSLALRYGSFEPLFAAALGLAPKRVGATVYPETVATGAYRHLFECDLVLSAMQPWQVTADGVNLGDLSGATQRKVRRGTVAGYREFGAWEWLSCMIDQLSLSWSASDVYGTCGVEMLAYSDTQSPSVNTPTTLRRAKPNTAPDVLFREGVIRLAPYSASTPLDDDDRIACESANVTVQNNLAVDFGPDHGTAPQEFERGSEVAVIGTLLKPRYADNTRVAAWRANTRYMLSMAFTGGHIPNTSTRYQCNVYVPGLFLTQVEPSPLSPARSSEPIQWYAAAPDTTPAGFPATKRPSPLIIEVVTGRASHTLL